MRHLDAGLHTSTAEQPQVAAAPGSGSGNGRSGGGAAVVAAAPPTWPNTMSTLPRMCSTAPREPSPTRDVGAMVCLAAVGLLGCRSCQLSPGHSSIQGQHAASAHIHTSAAAAVRAASALPTREDSPRMLRNAQEAKHRRRRAALHALFEFRVLRWRWWRRWHAQLSSTILPNHLVGLHVVAAGRHNSAPPCHPPQPSSWLACGDSRRPCLLLRPHWSG